MTIKLSSKLLTAFAILAMAQHASAQQQDTSNLRPAEIQAREATQMGSVIFAAKLGVVNVDNLSDNVISFGAFGDYGLSEQFMTGISIDYWQDTSGVISSNSVEVSNLSAGVHGRWVFTNLKAPFRPFALAGLALHRIRVSLSERVNDERAIDQFNQTYEDVENRAGVDIAGGIMYALDSSIDVIGEIRHRNLFDDKIRFDQWAFTGSLSYRL